MAQNPGRVGETGGLPRSAGAAGSEAESPPRREAILDAASELFAEHGFADADTQQLVDRLGVGKGTLYRHFPSKRELFLATADRVMRRLQERIEASCAGATDSLEQVELAVRAFLDFVAESPEEVELLMQERAQFRDRERPTFLVHRQRNVERWRELHRTLIREGRVRPMPVERITDVFGAVLYGAMFLSYASGRHDDFRLTAEDVLDVLLFGILSEDERRVLSKSSTEADAPRRPEPHD